MRLVPLALVLLAAGCTTILGPDEKRIVGIIPGLTTANPAIEVPATVQAGQDFTVTIQTGWRNTCARKDRTDVQAQGMSATVTPYDRVTEGAMCGQAPEAFTHTATLRFSQPGTAKVRIRGRASADGQVQTIERTVTVQ